jgi:hypothetical protein
MNIRRMDSIAASANVDDQLVAVGVREQLRRATRDGIVTVYLIQSATGLNVDITCGDRLQAAALQPVIKATAPIAPDDIVGAFPIRQGELVSMSVRNTTAGALTLGYFLDVP